MDYFSENRFYSYKIENTNDLI